MDSDWLNELSDKLINESLRVIRFEFPYMHDRRINGTKRPPNASKVLQSHWLEVISEHRQYKPIFIGGKSLGGRIASLIADEANISGLVCLGFPFHAPGKPAGNRIAHLASLKTPTLICQGERDPFGTRSEVKEYSLSSSIKLEWINDGDHSFKPRKKSGLDLNQNLNTVVKKISAFINSAKQ